MLAEHFQEMRMHERLAADDAEKDVAHLLAFANELMKSFRLDDLLLGGHVHPAPLATQITTVDDRNVEKRRKDLALFEPPFVLLNGANPLPAHIPGQLPQRPLIGLEQKSFGELEVHHR